MEIDTSQFRQIVILTGAGVSVASGIRPFRGDNGVWDEFNVEEYGHADRLLDAPDKIWQLFGPLRTQLLDARPNPAHIALAMLEQQLRIDQQFLLITQNIDGLHQNAGSRNVVELHGTIHQTCCANKGCDLTAYTETAAHADTIPLCPQCGSVLRPNVILFGESLPPLAEWQSKRALRDCDLFIAIGTSGTVSPAANFVRAAEYAGAHTVYINLEPLDPPNPAFKQHFYGKAEELLPDIFGVEV